MGQLIHLFSLSTQQRRLYRSALSQGVSMENEAGRRLFKLGVCQAQRWQNQVGFMLTINSREGECYGLTSMKKWLHRNQGAAIPVALG